MYTVVGYTMDCIDYSIPCASLGEAFRQYKEYDRRGDVVTIVGVNPIHLAKLRH